MKRIFGEVAYFINNRPLCLLTTLLSIRDFTLGLGFLLSAPELTRTILYMNVQDLMNPAILGGFLMIVAVITAIAAIVDKTIVTRTGLTVQAYTWLFACVTYILSGNYYLAIIFGLMCSAPSGYIAFYYKWTSIWVEHKKKWRLEHGLPE